MGYSVGQHVKVYDDTYLFQGDGPCGKVEAINGAVYSVRLTHDSHCNLLPTEQQWLLTMKESQLRTCNCP